ncbi:MAG: magnesium-translocating P-type ATPase [Planctomycetaceae bacterium]|nr:magnesium-translocating P-type ATPase [Planctomycetaceae bacterium]
MISRVAAHPYLLAPVFGYNAAFAILARPVQQPALFPKNLLKNGTSRIAALAKGQPAAVRVSPQLADAAAKPVDEVLRMLQTSATGLTEAEAEERLERHGPNEVASEKERGWLLRLLITMRNPLVVLLSLLSVLAFLSGDPRAGSVMALMVTLGVALRFAQESKADLAAAKLKAMITVTATAVRDGRPREVPLAELVPGDLIKLSAGDMIPADIRIISSKDLFIVQASLTGESMPVEKVEAPAVLGRRSPLELENVCFLGTSVESGTASAAVVATGPQTYFGGMARSLSGQEVTTSFDRGVNKFTWLMISLMAIMSPIVFLVNGLTKTGPDRWHEAFFFALAVAVGLTPEMLPMIVSVCLSKGAIAMSRKKVIVKRLNAIQNFGAMNVLCTDKTGTLTLDRVILEHHCDVVRQEDDGVLVTAYLISYFQTGLKNVLDRAILDHREINDLIPLERFQKIDEIPFDFQRRVMSVVVEMPEGGRRLLTKGAPEAIFRRCSRFELGGDVFSLEQIIIEDLKEEYEHLSNDGFRVLAVAYKDLDPRAAYSKDDETDLILTGYVAFLDPPKETASPAIKALQQHGVAVKVLTGDNELVSRKVCHEVGLPTDHMLLGGQVETMTDEQLAAAVETTTLFARLSPAHKQRIVQSLQRKGHVVGFMGDGINDAPGLRAADVGISVDTAVDIARESADLILLEKSLMVLEEGVLEGRKVFANILKYIRMGASSNFGNMFSVLGASALLKFLPMLPVQVLTNNLLYDFSQVPIPTDDIDPEQIARPRPWSIDEIRRFIFFIGPISSIFDYTTFFVMLYVFGCWDNPSLFQTGWFVESLMTQTLIIHIIRTNRIPFFQSRASWPLTVTTALIMGVGMVLPFTPLGAAIKLTPLPPLYWPILGVTLLCYAALTQLIKKWLLRKHWI